MTLFQRLLRRLPIVGQILIVRDWHRYEREEVVVHDLRDARWAVLQLDGKVRYVKDRLFA